MFFRHLTCRACGNSDLMPVLSLGDQYLANDFKAMGEENCGLAPLDLLYCKTCSLAQLSVVVSPQILYAKNYPYVTSRSETMRSHFVSLWSSIKDECNPNHVLEIGSNDGYFLEFCKQYGAEMVVGIDPAENLRPDVDESPIISVCGVFDAGTAAIAHTAMPVVDVIVARHVFAHVDDWQGFVKNLELIASKETLVVIEVPYVMDMLEKVELDQIYHEHLSYVSIQAVEHLLKGSAFHIHKVQRFPIHGGAIVFMLRRNDSEKYPHPIPDERITSLDWDKFSDQAEKKIRDLTVLISEMVYDGRTICGYGASAKSTVWINACGFTSKEIKFICDCTPNKQGKFSPGTDIPVVPESELRNQKTDYCVLFSHNYSNEILTKENWYLRTGGKFILPVPNVEIISEYGTPKTH